MNINVQHLTHLLDYLVFPLRSVHSDTHNGCSFDLKHKELLPFLCYQHEDDQWGQSLLNESADLSSFHIQSKLAALCLFCPVVLRSNSWEEEVKVVRAAKDVWDLKNKKIKCSRLWNRKILKCLHVLRAGVSTGKAKVSLKPWWMSEPKLSSLQKGTVGLCVL